MADRPETPIQHGGVSAPASIGAPGSGHAPPADVGSAGGAGERRPAVSLPKAGGAVRRLSEKLSVNSANGTAKLSVPLPLSPGRDGFTPHLSLSYDSGTGNGTFGMGWSLDLAAITRRTDKGLPQYRDAEESDVFVAAGAEDLVPELDSNGTPVRSARTVHGVAYQIASYRPRVEGIYARIERWTVAATGVSHWRTISNDNVTTLFGFDEGSTVVDHDHPRRVFSYLVSRRFDAHGQLIVFTYATENGDGVELSSAHESGRTPAGRSTQRYLKSVRYGNVDPWFADWGAGGAEPPLPDADRWLFELVLDYGEHDPDTPTPHDQGTRDVRPDPFSTYRAGFEVRTYRRCRRILMFHHFPNEPHVGTDCLVKALDLSYSDEQDVPDPTSPVYTLLSSATEIGYRRDGIGYRLKALPPLELEYSRVTIDPTIRRLDPDSAANLPEGLDGSRYRWVDLDSEGLPGVLTEDHGTWRFKRNLSPLTTVPPPGADAPSATARLGPQEEVGDLPTAHALAGGLRLLDLKGSGQLDAVTLGDVDPGYAARISGGGWEPFVPFRSLPSLDWHEPRLQFVDLTGDGQADVLLGEEDLWTFFPSLGSDGFGPAISTPAPWDEDRGARVVFADGTETVHLADVSGDGLPDLVRIRNGEVCYWPNLGYGRFGPRITMDGAPRFADEELYDPRRVRLADIDGSGTTDLVYVSDRGVLVCFNRSGNTWGEPESLAVFPSADQLSSLQAIDLLGIGTACLVWSTPLPGGTGATLHYVDLMSGRKPHLLSRTRNNLGGETRLHYAPSTRFALQDRQRGQPWITRLPFPVQVVERVEIYDWIERSRSVNRYAYHHGYFDGDEREFRGFGMVEQWDTEEHRADLAFPVAQNWDATSWSPPVHTKTWFHTGALVEAEALSRAYAAEYWTEPGLAGDDHAADRAATVLPEPTIDPGLTAIERREAHRALKGLMLRSESYAEDRTASAAIPYTVTEQTFTVRRLQPLGGNRHAVFTSHLREQVTLHYDRIVDDPRVTHEVTLEVDAFDHPLKTISVAYPRRPGHPEPEPGLTADFRQMLGYDQARLHMTATTHGYTNAVLDADVRQLPRPCETITADVTGVRPAATGPGVSNLFTFAELDAAWAEVINDAHDAPYEEIVGSDIDGTGPGPTTETRRIVEQERIVYRRDDLSGLLPVGQLQSHALPGDRYRLAFTPSLLTRTLGTRVGAVELEEGGYVQLAGHSGWWIPAEQIHYSAGDGDLPAVELVEARGHFYRSRRTVDRFSIRRTDLDPYDLLPIRAVDGVGNVHGAVNDYRVLEAAEVRDPNGNRAEVAFDAIGNVVASAVMGKDNEQLGDSLAGLVADLDDGTIADHLADPLGDPLALLQKASARMVYDIDAYFRTRDSPQPEPPVVWTIERETHVSDLAPGDTTRVRHAFVYSDGSGRQIQTKVRAEAGPVVDGGPDLDPRWVCSGWVINDNKGRPVRKYEPFFTATHHFEFAAQVGSSSVTLYDPVGRAIATLHPDDTWHKASYGPWKEELWDRNDTALIADPRADPDVGDFFRRLFGDDPGAYTSWRDQRIGGTFGATAEDRAAAKDAAEKVADHAGTPAVEHFDPMGRSCLFVTDLGGPGGRHGQRNVFDAEGSPLALLDAKNRRVIEYVLREPQQGGGTTYVTARDLAGRELFHNQMDGGERRMLPDIVDHPIRSWDARDHQVRLLYDATRRPTHRYVSTNGAPEVLVSRTVYGEGMADRNLCGEVFRHFDQAGVSGNDLCDFKGNLVDRSRQLALEYRTDPDWTPLAAIADPAALDAVAAPLLEDERFVAHAVHDALNRPLQVATPHTAAMQTNVVRSSFNEAGMVEKVDVWEQVGAVPPGLLDPATADIHAVTDIDYDAQGRRVMVAYGNGAITEHEHDPLSQRLTRLTTTRPGTFAVDERVVQDLKYTHDPVGNVTRLRDDADIHDVVFFRNQRVVPSSDYTYDAGYRLIRATGREHLGQANGSLAPAIQTDDGDGPRGRLAHPGDGSAMGTYVESYDYDPVGNLLTMVHQVASGSWTRRYDYHEPSVIDPLQTSNRLSATSLPGDPLAGPFSARCQYDAHGNTTGMSHLSTVTWDEQNQLRSSSRQVVNAGTPETTFYLYDAGGQRVRKVTDNQSAAGPGSRRKERIYLGAFELYREFGPDGQTVTLTRETLLISAARRTVAMLERRTSGDDPGPARLVRYQYTNHISSTALELDESAGVISYEEYFPYGSTSYQSVRNQTDVPKRLRWAGKERDEESGFYYHAARYYAPWIARWTSPDPTGISDGPNLYLFAHANPVTVTDPSGTAGLVIGGGIVLTWEAVTWLGAGLITATGIGIIATDPNVHIRERLQPHQYSDEPWPSPAPAPPVTVPVPPPPVPAPPIPVPRPPVPVPAPPIPVPVPPIPIPVPPIPIPIPVPVPHAGPLTAPRPRPGPDPKRDREPKPDGPGPDPIPDPRPRRRRGPQVRYVTYTKTNPRTGRVYVGRARGTVNEDPRAIVARRDRGHVLLRRAGYGPAKLDKSLDATRPLSSRWLDPSYQAIRGREQQLIDKFGGSKSDHRPGSRSGNRIRGVAKINPLGRIYDAAATASFGRAHRYTGY